MLDRLEIQEKEDSPYVILDPVDGHCEISGKSFPPDVASFFEPVLYWLKEYKELKRKKINLNLKLDYFNTASSKLLLDVLYKLEEISFEGTDVIVNWYYPEDDEDMLDTGEEYEGLVDIPFRHISYDKEY